MRQAVFLLAPSRKQACPIGNNAMILEESKNLSGIAFEIFLKKIQHYSLKKMKSHHHRHNLQHPTCPFHQTTHDQTVLNSCR
jgi:hypothetical protein